MKNEKEPVSMTVNLMDVVQSKQFESDIITQLNSLSVNDQAKLRPYRYEKVKIWNAAAVAAEYRKIMTRQSKETGTRRLIITKACQKALSETFKRMEGELHAKVVMKKTPKAPSRKKKVVAS